MTSANLYRWSGLALLVGAIVAIIGNVLSAVLFPGNVNPPPSQMTVSTILGLLSLIGQMPALIGLAGLAVRQAREAGGLGLVGYALTFFGGFLLTSFQVVAIVVFPWLFQVAPNAANSGPPPSFFTFFLISNILFGVGGLLLGLAVMRGGVFPRTAGLLLLIGAVLNALGFPLNGVLSTIVSTVSFVLFAVGLAWMGYVLWQEQHLGVIARRVA
jgi:hypothetical protein